LTQVTIKLISSIKTVANSKVRLRISHIGSKSKTVIRLQRLNQHNNKILAKPSTTQQSKHNHKTHSKIKPKATPKHQAKSNSKSAATSETKAKSSLDQNQ